MAELLLDQIRSQIRDRRRELEPAVLESERLTAALSALNSLGTVPPAKRESAPKPASKPPSRRSSSNSGRRSTGRRASRGANRAAVLGVLSERPGVSVSELSSAASVGRPVLYTLLKTLEQRGEVVKEELPGGVTGYRLAADASPESAISASNGAGH